MISICVEQQCPKDALILTSVYTSRPIYWKPILCQTHIYFTTETKYKWIFEQEQVSAFVLRNSRLLIYVLETPRGGNVHNCTKGRQSVCMWYLCGEELVSKLDKQIHVFFTCTTILYMFCTVNNQGLAKVNSVKKKTLWQHHGSNNSKLYKRHYWK